jgi:hypothetical protein
VPFKSGDVKKGGCTMNSSIMFKKSTVIFYIIQVLLLSTALINLPGPLHLPKFLQQITGIIRARAEAKEDKAFLPFSTKLQELAKYFELDQIEALIIQYIDKGKE